MSDVPYTLRVILMGQIDRPSSPGLRANQPRLGQALSIARSVLDSRRSDGDLAAVADHLQRPATANTAGLQSRNSPFGGQRRDLQIQMLMRMMNPKRSF
jgi:hypothetical protein